MKKIYLSQIPNGSPIPYDLYNDKDVILIKKGTKMTSDLKKKLQRNNIIYLTPQITPFDILDDRIKYLDDDVVVEIEKVKKVYSESFYELSREFETFKESKRLDHRVIADIAENLISSISNNQQVYASIQGIRRKDAYTYLHSIDVAILMILLGNSMNMNNRDIEDAAISGLLHDIGKTKIADNILLKPDKLTEDEQIIMQKHTTYGYDILRDQMGYKESIYRPAREHHETMDGLGYPDRISGRDMHLYSKMVAICDIYDAITADRVYKNAMLPHVAVEYIMSISNKKLDSVLVRQFIQNIAIYPIGTKVLLNTNEMGIIVENNEGFSLRPKVHIIGTDIRRDLLTEMTVFIENIIE